MLEVELTSVELLFESVDLNTGSSIPVLLVDTRAAKLHSPTLNSKSDAKKASSRTQMPAPYH